MYEFIDAFFIGEAEEAIGEITAVMREKRTLSREELLSRLSRIEGIYVPSLYKGQGKIRKRFVRDLENAPFPVDWLVPYIQTVHDRVTVEIMRGCPNRCRFCQARVQYYPLRIRKPETVLRLAEEAYRNTGYEEISLAGLSVSDHPCLKEILAPLVKRFKADGIGVSLPSIKPSLMLGELSTVIASIRKTGRAMLPACLA
jgi:radical SAM superfamily enzyme YgiQ (UPF0313 family)